MNTMKRSSAVALELSQAVVATVWRLGIGDDSAIGLALTGKDFHGAIPGEAVIGRSLRLTFRPIDLAISTHDEGFGFRHLRQES
jgi:hypothetical protein